MITFDHVGLRYGTGDEILKDITYTFKKGGFYYLTGVSGAGKSSLIQLMYAALMPTRGFVRIFNYDINTMPENANAEIRRKIGVIFQDFRLITDISVAENIALPLRIANYEDETVQKRVRAILQWTNMIDHEHAFPKTLSGGQQQIVAIARAVINQPNILLADEPTGSLDSQIAERILQMVDELHRLGTTVIFATHNRDIINRYPHVELRLQQGHLHEIIPS